MRTGQCSVTCQAVLVQKVQSQKSRPEEPPRTWHPLNFEYHHIIEVRIKLDFLLISNWPRHRHQFKSKGYMGYMFKWQSIEMGHITWLGNSWEGTHCTHLIDWRPAITRTVLFRMIPTENEEKIIWGLRRLGKRNEHNVLQWEKMWEKIN